MEEAKVVLALHDQKIKALERELAAMREVQAEIRKMNEALVTLATELSQSQPKYGSLESRKNGAFFALCARRVRTHLRLHCEKITRFFVLPSSENFKGTDFARGEA